MTTDPRIPLAHRARFDEIAALIEHFGQIHLDAELTGFAIEFAQAKQLGYLHPDAKVEDLL